MAAYFTADFQIAWAIVLGLVLFLPVRQLIWSLSIRRAEKRDGSTDNEQKLVLKKRAGMTSILLCLVFAYFYTAQLFSVPQ
ncbi:MAG: hypothetical protein CMM74_09905 [Rhodospirillaceae bacterium]|jgi:hypothetical protein|nr:hypothetical protein [Rhodospirillaceae bacterium]|tara:strand:+ start:510 stop:752 length:243 start_codon:yes stop_codon:yes gene_type:complete